MSSKVKVAKLSIISNTLLIIMKFVVGMLSGSVSIISEAIHSTMDLVAALIAFFSVKISDTPPDEEHPYGHQKVENVSGVIEAILIFLASILIIKEAVKKIVENEPVKSVGLGFIVMFVAALVNTFVSRRLYKVAKEVDSVALEADALHLKTDVYTSLGVGVGLLLIWLTGLNFLDPIVAIFVAAFILKEAWSLLKSAFDPLLDTRLSTQEVKLVTECIDKEKNLYCNYHQLRTRKAGNKRYVDLHLVVSEKMSVKQAHDICDSIEEEIENKLKNTEVMIHVESCTKKCTECEYKKG